MCVDSFENFWNELEFLFLIIIETNETNTWHEMIEFQTL
jgi:hypothetical protein